MTAASTRRGSGLLERLAFAVAFLHLVRGGCDWTRGLGARRRWRRELALGRFRRGGRCDGPVIFERKVVGGRSLGSSRARGTAPLRQTAECAETVGRRGAPPLGRTRRGDRSQFRLLLLSRRFL